MEELIVSSFVQIGKLNLNVPNHTLMRRRAMVNPDPCPSRPCPRHVLPPCECSVPLLSPSHLSSICFHPFLVLLCLPLVYMSASPSQCQHHCPGVGEAAVCTQQSGCFCLDCEAGGRDSEVYGVPGCQCKISLKPQPILRLAQTLGCSTRQFWACGQGGS